MSKESAGTALTTGKIAEQLGVSPAKVKKAIAELQIVPTSMKGVCAYYDTAAVKKLAAALK